MNRREFQTWTAAALSGLLTGTFAGCGSAAAGPPFGEPHVCRGLNACKGKGRDGKNTCAGRGACATAAHDCAGKNQCQSQGGCGSAPAANSCSGKGGCTMPLMDSAWKKVRQRFEGEMGRRGVQFGPAPPAAP